MPPQSSSCKTGSSDSAQKLMLHSLNAFSFQESDGRTTFLSFKNGVDSAKYRWVLENSICEDISQSLEEDRYAI